ncbi:unnamed protein product [Linum trigynum]
MCTKKVGIKIFDEVDDRPSFRGPPKTVWVNKARANAKPMITLPAHREKATESHLEIPKRVRLEEPIKLAHHSNAGRKPDRHTKSPRGFPVSRAPKIAQFQGQQRTGTNAPRAASRDAASDRRREEMAADRDQLVTGARKSSRRSGHQSKKQVRYPQEPRKSVPMTVEDRLARNPVRPTRRRRLLLQEEEEDTQMLPIQKRAPTRRLLRGTHNVSAAEKGKGKLIEVPLPAQDNDHREARLAAPRPQPSAQQQSSPRRSPAGIGAPPGSQHGGLTRSHMMQILAEDSEEEWIPEFKNEEAADGTQSSW